MFDVWRVIVSLIVVDLHVQCIEFVDRIHHINIVIHHQFEKSRITKFCVYLFEMFHFLKELYNVQVFFFQVFPKLF